MFGLMNLVQNITSRAADTAGSDPERRIPKRVRHACDLILSGECATIKAAAERVNLSREHLSRMIAQPHVQAYLTRKTRESIAGLQMRAAAVLDRLMSAESEHVQKDVAIRVLELNGIRPPPGDAPVQINISPGYVIDLSGGQQGDRQIGHLASEPAKPLIDITPVPAPEQGTRQIEADPVNPDEGQADE